MKNPSCRGARGVFAVARRREGAAAGSGPPAQAAFFLACTSAV